MEPRRADCDGRIGKNVWRKTQETLAAREQNEYAEYLLLSTVKNSEGFPKYEEEVSKTAFD